MLINDPYSPLMSELEERIALDEGFRRHLYRCPAGKLTIGYGWMIEDGIDEAEALVLMRFRLLRVHTELARRLPWYAGITPGRQQALVSMAYQMGIAGLMRFGKMLRAASRGDWLAASHEALDSKWARVDSPARARRLATMLVVG